MVRHVGADLLTGWCWSSRHNGKARFNNSNDTYLAICIQPICQSTPTLFLSRTHTHVHTPHTPPWLTARAPSPPAVSAGPRGGPAGSGCSVAGGGPARPWRPTRTRYAARAASAWPSHSAPSPGHAHDLNTERRDGEGERPGKRMRKKNNKKQ